MDDHFIKNKVILLDDHTANRIAAGEVVERPLSVVKELVENSIDADANQISIILEDAGKDLIKIIDNGFGMSRDDAVMALQRHATSKISSADDLYAINTLGFRGEALPSIASVSIMEIITRERESDEAIKLTVNAGTIENLETIGAPTGTTITIKNLFFNTPARLKFLKTTQTELSHIVEIVNSLSLANPNIRFRLTHNGREMFSSAGTGSRFNSIVEVLGRDTAKQLVPIKFETPVLKVDGYVSNQGLDRINRKQQLFFVNSRIIRSRTITHALDTAYRDLLPLGRYPVAIIYIDLAPELVDVNVHPTKAEVKFMRENDIHSAVYQAINTALMSGSAAPTIIDSKTTEVSNSSSKLSQHNYRIDQRTLINPTESEMERFRAMLNEKNQQTISSNVSNDPFDWEKGKGVPVEESPVPDVNTTEIRTVSLKGVKLIGQIKNMYMIVECDDGILIIDQHIAHERVLYESFIKEKEESKQTIQMLVMPVTLSLGQKESQIVLEKLEDLKKSGFLLEPFGKDTFLLRGVPASVKLKDAEITLKDMIDELVDISISKHFVVRQDQVLITASCKMAVKAGDSLSIEELQKLLDDLLKCDNPFVCPHGRPIIVSLSNWELERKFHRR